MNLDNRRLREIQTEKEFFKQRLEEAKTITDSLTYKGKIDILTKEEQKILKRCNIK